MTLGWSGSPNTGGPEKSQIACVDAFPDFEADEDLAADDDAFEALVGDVLLALEVLLAVHGPLMDTSPGGAEESEVPKVMVGVVKSCGPGCGHRVRPRVREVWGQEWRDWLRPSRR